MRLTVAALLAACGGPPTPSPEPPFPGPFLGQWVWAERDLGPLSEARRSRAVVAGVYVASVRYQRGEFRNELALPPTTAPGPRELVVRVEDDLHAAWDVASDQEIADGLGDALVRVLELARSRGPVDVLQLDHDVPERRLARWGAVLRAVRPRLGVSALWMTSLVAHVKNPAFSGALSGTVDGHVLQVFDTGDDPGTAGDVARWAADAGIPWRLGLASFEREVERPIHRAWFGRAGEACRPPLCDGVWVFPAGTSWVTLVDPPPPLLSPPDPP